jgi:glutaminyl-peptide cyclotransferase
MITELRTLRLLGWLVVSMLVLWSTVSRAAQGVQPSQSSPPSVVLAPRAVPVYGYDVVHVYPHDVQAFTEGLFYADGYLYESTGLNGQSSIRKERLATGEVVRKATIPGEYFGEGMTLWGQRLITLTWQSHVGFIFDATTFKRLGEFHYAGEGWALTHDDHALIMSDGTAELRLLEPTSLREIGRIRVTLGGKPVDRLNELEWVKGEIYANIWQTDWIVRIDPRSGEIKGLINLEGLLPASDRIEGQTDVLNGIAYDATTDRLFVTGKNWPKLFEIRLKRTGDFTPK